MVKDVWSEEDSRKAIKAFREVYPDWTILSNQPNCPKPNCHKPNFCKKHHYAYEKFLGSEAGVPLLALKDAKLKEALQKEFRGDFPSSKPIFRPLHK
jgi:hypothetical protein